MWKIVILLFAIVCASADESSFDQNALDSASLPVEHRGADGFGVPLGGLGGPGFPGQGLPSPGFGGHGLAGPAFGQPVPQQIGGPEDPWPLAQADTPQIKNLQVQCEKSFMRVSVEFDRPFYGMIFSKGYYSDPNCVHVPAGSGILHAQYDIYLNACGMTSSSNAGNFGQPTPSGSFIENIIIVQYDPLVQEVWDAARKLRCTWYDYYEKSVTFRPFQVDMLNAVTANFLGDNLQCWMQIQVGKGPWASEVSGIVKIGQTMTMVLAIKDDENKFDMMVRNCVAHDGKRTPIQLVDERGCVTRPKIMTRFEKIRDFGPSASVLSYAYFQAFKFPDSMNVHFQCVIQVCRHNCPEPHCGGPIGGLGEIGGLDSNYLGAASNQVPAGLPDPRQNQVDPRQNTLDQYIPSGSEVSEKRVPVALKQVADEPSASQGESVNRDGIADLAGRPRRLDLDKQENENTKKTKRSALYENEEVQEMTDISTERVIQVVAPGDVAFNLNAQNETVIVSQHFVDDGSSICMSATGFAAGLIMLLLVLAISCIIACFMYTRVRAFNNKGGITTFVQGYDNPEFVKIASSN